MNAPTAPRFETVRLDKTLRRLRVARVERLTPHMQRVTLEGKALADFRSPGFDDHVKVLVPKPAKKKKKKKKKGKKATTTDRSYTVRRFDPEARTLVLDFALHEAGPATRWALDVQPGDRAEIVGPKSSRVVRSPIAHHVLVGDETALPAIGRCVEEAAPGIVITTIGLVPEPADQQTWTTAGDHTAHWLHAPDDARDPADVIALLEPLPLGAGTLVWMAGESNLVKAVRRWLLDDREHPKAWLRTSGYWKRKRPKSEK